jgi:hypothetical protein
VPSKDGGTARTFTVQGKPLSVKVQVLTPPVHFQGAKEALDRHTALGCAQQLYAHLATGDIEKAASLSDDPAASKANYARLLDRLGPEAFQKTFAAYLGPAGLELRMVLSVGTHSMLIVRNPEMGMDAAQFYASSGGVFHVEDQKSREREQLGRLFQQLKNDDGIVVLP